MAKKKNQCDEVKRCIICNKPIENEDDMFGGGCLDNLYELLDTPVPKRISNKEKYLLDAIAHKNSKYFLSREKKIAIAKNYIAWSYLNKINLNFTKDEKSKLEDNIKNISPFKSLQSSYIPEYLLNDFYKVYNYYMRFEEKINNYTTKSNDNLGKKEEINDETILKGLSFIFNTTKERKPLFHMAFYDMQYIFWETVVIGGYLFDKPLSGYLLRLSLNNNYEYNEENPLIIEDKYFNNLLFGYDEFKRVINDYLKGEKVNIKNQNVEFSEGDLLFAIHGAKLNISAEENENGNWDLTVEIIDKYDYTDLKMPKEYIKSFDSKSKSLLASTLNNYAAVSSSYGVIRPFNFIIKVEKRNYETKK